MPPPPVFAPLRESDLSRAAALSALIGWNQTAADWALFRRHGAVRALLDDDDAAAALAATAATLPYAPAGAAGTGAAPELAWISMVLVRPDRRRSGLATALMRWAVESLAGLRCAALDATPAGREVYRRLGFRDLWVFRRWALPDALPAETGIAVRAARADDWPALLALDGAAFGARRDFLLRDFVARLPHAALVAEGPGGGGVTGFALARDGVRTPQIGPVLAPDAATARALIAAALAALPPAAPGQPRAVIDLRDAAPEGLAAWIGAHGGTVQRPFTRMALGADPPGDPAPMVAVAGPEFG